MDTIPAVAQAMHRVLSAGAERAAATTGFVQRRSKLTGAGFVQCLVFGWLAEPGASLCSLAQMTAVLGEQVSPQGLFQRFTPQAAACLQAVLAAGVSEMLATRPVALPLLQRFSAVLVQDSTTITLPNALQEVWAGCGGRGGAGQSALKLQVRLDLTTGRLEGPFLDHGRTPDSSAVVQRTPVPRGALRLADLGYFHLDTLRAVAAAGGYFLSRFKVGTTLYAGTGGTPLDLSAWLARRTTPYVDTPVRLGRVHRLAARLLAVPVPPTVSAQRRRRLKERARKQQQPLSKARLTLCDWTILITNAPPSLLSLEEALVLARARWQIELLFKLWKQQGQIDQWRSANPWRILCEIYAKLLAMLVLHWTLLVSCWRYPDRSLVKGARHVRRYVMVLALSLAGVCTTESVLQQIAQALRVGCRIEKRRKRPSAFQLLLAPLTYA